MIIGLVGGVASGKSFVARKLAALTNGLVVDADSIAKAKLSDAFVSTALKSKFGDSVFHHDGQVDRSAVAQRVFGDSPIHAENRQWLNDLIHPLVREEIQAIIANEQAKSDEPWIVLDIPLLLESGWDKACDRVIFVDTPKHLREVYAAKRGWAGDELLKREQSQISIDEKRDRATDVVVNTGVESELQATLVQWLAKLKT